MNLGNEYLPFADDHLACPHLFYHRARKEEPVFYSPVLNTWVVTTYTDVLAILRAPEIFSSRDTLRPLIELTPRVFEELVKGYPPVPITVNTDGIEHQRFRVPLKQALAPSRVAAMEPMMRATARRLLDGFVADGHAEMVSQFASPFSLAVILSFFGIPTEFAEQGKRWCDDGVALFSTPLSEERQVECARSFIAFEHFFAGLIEEKRHSLKEDLIRTVLTTSLPEARPLDIVELIKVLPAQLIAGYASTTNLISSGLKVILEYPNLWHTLCDSPDLIPQAIEEILRLESPVPAFCRTATQDTDIGGITIPKDSLLLLVFGSANRDETEFSNPDAFDLRRFSNRHVSFGHGTHYCLGSSLARLVGQVALETLSQRLYDLRLQPDQEFEYIPALMFRGLTRLEAIWSKVSR